MPRLLVLAAFCLVLPACGGESSESDLESDSVAVPLPPDTSTLAQQVERDAAFEVLAAEGTPDLDDFVLTPDRMERWGLASTYLLGLTESKPSLAALWREDGAAPTSYEEMLARIEAEPEATRQVERAGLSAREFTAIGVVYLRAKAALRNPAAAMEGQPGATAANIEYVREHRAQIDSLLLPPARPAATL